MVEVKRKKGESFESLMRRFGRRMSSSGRILESRKHRFYSAEPSKSKMHDSALRRETIREKREWLIKTGKLVETRRRGRRR